MNTRVFLALCSLTVITACSPFVASPAQTASPTPLPTPTLLPNQALTLLAPELPLQVDGLDVPQAEGAILLLAATADLSGLPEGMRKARTDVVRAETHLVPVAANGQDLAAETNGKTTCAVMTTISRRNPEKSEELQTLILDETASKNGEYWVYTSGGVTQYVPKTVTRPGNLDVYLAVDRRLGKDGKAYYVAVDADGHLKQVMDAVSAEQQPGQWRTVQAGEFGLKGHEALLNAPGLTGNREKIKTEFDPDLGGEKVIVYAFTDPESNEVKEFPPERIEWLPIGEKTQVNEEGEALGSVVLRGAEGEIEYVWRESGWTKVEKVESPNGTGAVALSAAGWQFIEIGKRLLVLDPSKNEVNSQGQEVVVSEAGERYVWNENGWRKEGPPVKEFTVCPDIKKYREAYIPAEDLMSGAYHAWLEREFPQEYDLNTIQQVPFAYYGGASGPSIVYDRDIPHYFGDRENRPYVNDLTFGYTEFDGIVYAVMPVNYHDPSNPGRGRWVVTVMSLSVPGYEINEATRQAVFDIWLKNYRITPIVMSSVTPMRGFEDPLVAETFKKWPDMANRFQAVLENGDIAQISEPGMVLMTFVGTGAVENWVK